MQQNKYNIFFTLHHSGNIYRIKTRRGEYHNLMQLITEKVYTDDFGDCKGMGRCGTCVVEVDGPGSGLRVLQDNEQTTIGRAAFTGENIRLACRIMIDEELNEATVRVMENY